MDSNDRLSAIGRALSCTVRLSVLQALAEADASVGELTGRMSVTQPNMSNHLAVLRSAGLVTSHRFGRVVRYRLASPEVASLVASLTLLATTDAGSRHGPPLSKSGTLEAASDS
ncbi:ArsR/SmtB family transcription factor [Nonomuraea sp. NPDC050790]|uniref:ArsR/SmtB family transcription factor n=1 Tax=Nonomuraea sp. NPDC050790 TaxID=3364371 RepID=UPI00379812CB